ncbi:AMIN-like domain-containing (lipo)protein [Pseudonocardia aurantiaca]|uniref:AMIN-like domain-containing protein n=1 Tax=Pseudonocardia aurantiaca TaxID=75290 RepID=A0ABW4FH21_9PSEU
MSSTARRALTVLLALAGVALPVTAIFVPAVLPAAAPVCSISWGSAPEDVRVLGRAPVTAVGTGSDRCWDRVVFTLPGPAAGYSVAYVDTVEQDGSGDVLPVPGGAKLRVQLHHPAYDDGGNATLTPPVSPGRPLADVSGFRTLRSVIYGGSFEGGTTIGVGTRTRLPFRVFTLEGPGSGSRIVIDVAHHW